MGRLRKRIEEYTSSKATHFEDILRASLRNKWTENQYKDTVLPLWKDKVF